MRSLAKGLIVMVAISGLAFMGCDNGTTNGNGGNGNDPGNRVIAEQYRGSFRVENVQVAGAERHTITIVLNENTVTRHWINNNIPPQEGAYPPFPAWTEGNTLRGQPGTMILTLGSFSNVDTFEGTGYWFGTHTLTRVPQE